jgi:GNAT superfamily N-acetyltransferase
MLAVDVDTDATGLVAAVDELYGHLAHRRALVERPDVGARLAPAMRAVGWLAEHDVYSVLRRQRDRPAAPGLAREVDEPTMRAVEAQTIAQQPTSTEAAVGGQLLASRTAFGRAGRARYFVGAADGVDASHATLYSDGVIAQVEDVATLEEFRGRGLARAVCSAAIDAALETGHELVFIIADDDDWPKELYAKLGFDPVGKPWSFTRPPVGHAAHRS